jgi:hypothetical protein
MQRRWSDAHRCADPCYRSGPHCRGYVRAFGGAVGDVSLRAFHGLWARPPIPMPGLGQSGYGDGGAVVAVLGLRPQLTDSWWCPQKLKGHGRVCAAHALDTDVLHTRKPVEAGARRKRAREHA